MLGSVSSISGYGTAIMRVAVASFSKNGWAVCMLNLNATTKFDSLWKDVFCVGSSPLAISFTDGFETRPLFHYTTYAGLLLHGCGLQPNPILKYTTFSSTLVKFDYFDVSAC